MRSPISEQTQQLRAAILDSLTTNKDGTVTARYLYDNSPGVRALADSAEHVSRELSHMYFARPDIDRFDATEEQRGENHRTRYAYGIKQSAPVKKSSRKRQATQRDILIKTLGRSRMTATAFSEQHPDLGDVTKISNLFSMAFHKKQLKREKNTTGTNDLYVYFKRGAPRTQKEVKQLALPLQPKRTKMVQHIMPELQAAHDVHMRHLQAGKRSVDLDVSAKNGVISIDVGDVIINIKVK